MERIHIIGCGVMERDFTRVSESCGASISAEYLPAGLHATPAELRLQLQAAIDRCSVGCGFDRLIIGYGICGRGVVGIRARRIPLIIPRVHDCISLFLGSNAAYKEQFLKCPGTFYISAGWYEKKVQPGCSPTRKTPFPNADREFDRLRERYGEENAREIVDFLNSWQRNYERAVFIDTGSGDTASYEAYAKAMADEFGWRYERVKGDLSLLENAISVATSTPELLLVPPGHIVQHDAFENTLVALPEWHADDLGRNPAADFHFPGANGPTTVQRRARLGLGIDAGGTYTDAVVYDFARQEVLATAKSLTTRWNYTLGIVRAIEQLNWDTLGQIDLVTVSTTLATNAIVEGFGQRVGLLLMPPGNVVPTDIQHEPRAVVAGRLSIDGSEQEPLQLAQVRAVARKMIDQDGVRAFAVSGYAGNINPEHERIVKETLQEEFDLAVIAGHELSDQLNFCVRANTAVLNARIIPLLKRFLREVKDALQEHQIDAALAVVKGDGSLMSTEMAQARPIETILSGPAASVTGARYLTGLEEATVLDIGGTTSDLARLRQGKVKTRAAGAMVGGWRTHVRALDMRTIGLGGDSTIILDQQELIIGPQRVAPISCLTAEFPACLGILDRLTARLDEFKQTTRPMQLLALTGRQPDFEPNPQEQELIHALADGPESIAELVVRLNARHWKLLHVKRLEEHFVIYRAGLTPTDILHAQGRLNLWEAEAAVRMLRGYATLAATSPESFGTRVVDRVCDALAVQLLKKQLDEHVDADDMDDCKVCGWLQENILGRGVQDLSLQATLKHPVIGLGAPAQYFLPAAAAKLHAELIIPPHAGVANAVGAITGWVRVSKRAAIQPDEVEGFVVKGLATIANYRSVATATEESAAILAEDLRAMAQEAGTSQRQVNFEINDHIVTAADGTKVFLERLLVGTIAGPPDVLQEMVENT